jgi:hypothetical protein
MADREVFARGVLSTIQVLKRHGRHKVPAMVECEH